MYYLGIDILAQVCARNKSNKITQDLARPPLSQRIVIEFDHDLKHGFLFPYIITQSNRKSDSCRTSEVKKDVVVCVCFSTNRNIYSESTMQTVVVRRLHAFIISMNMV